jgi:RES domain-containing protein
MGSYWRISNYEDLSGIGGLKYPGRWHTRGSKVVYLTDSSAGALLESLVHLEIDGGFIPDFYNLLRIEIPDGLAIQPLSPLAGSDWMQNEASTQAIGDQWLAEVQTPLAQVSSAIAYGRSNYLLNPLHPDADKARIVAATRQRYDQRLFRFGSR